MKARLTELDSLRGLAALTVVFSHFTLTYPDMDWVTYGHGLNLMNVWKYTPLHIFWAGYEAVLFFFVLSGFVLALPFFKESRPSYGAFIVKRICRIYIPYIVAVVLAMLAYRLFHHQVTTLSQWYDTTLWTTPLTWQIIIQHIAMIGTFDSNAYDPVLWSLVIEMRISLILPFVMIAISRLNWRTTAALSILILLLSIHLDSFVSGIWVDWNHTLEYLPTFMIGALVAKHHRDLVLWFSARHYGVKVAIVCMSIVAYTYAWFPFYQNKFWHGVLLDNMIPTLGACAFIIVALPGNYFSKFLRTKPISHLGKVSYSLYLVHFILFLTITDTLIGHVRLRYLYIIVLISAVGVATLMYHLVERPSIRLGRLFAAKFTFSKSTIIELQETLLK